MTIERSTKDYVTTLPPHEAVYNIGVRLATRIVGDVKYGEDDPALMLAEALLRYHEEDELTQMVLRVGCGPQPGQEWVPVTPEPIGPRRLK